MGVKVRFIEERWAKRPDGTYEKVALPNPYWAVKVDWKGKRKFAKAEGGKREAMAKGREIEAKLIGEEMQDGPPPVLFKDYAETFLKRTEAVRRWGTLVAYKSAVNVHLDPAFGNLGLREITRAHVRDFLFSCLERGMAAGSVHTLKAVLSAILNSAVEDEYITVNPASRAGRKLPPAARGNNFLSPENAEALLAVLREQFPEIYLPVLLGLRGGMRTGEALGMSWDDVDFGAKTLTVRRSFSRKRFGQTKTGKERTIPMSGEVEAALRAHRAVTAAAKLRSGNRSNWLFVNPETEKPFGDGWLLLRLERALEAAKLPRMTFHMVGRHSFASHLHHAGAAGPVVRDLGGWADAAIVNRYSHAIGGREEVNRLDELGKIRKPAQT